MNKYYSLADILFISLLDDVLSRMTIHHKLIT